MLHVIAHYRTVEGRGDEVAAVLERHKVSIEAEPGCVFFDVFRSAGDPDVFVLVEAYDDERAFQEHRHSRHFIENIDGIVVPLLAERSWQRYAPVSTTRPGLT